MDRGVFRGIWAGTSPAAPLADGAQVATKPVAGVLYQGAPFGSITISIREAMTQGLREEGYLEGQNIRLEHRYADFAGLPDGAKDLVRLNVDIIMAVWRRATSSSPSSDWTEPIVED